MRDDMWTRGAFFFPVGCTDLKPDRVVSGAELPPLHTYLLATVEVFETFPDFCFAQKAYLRIWWWLILFLGLRLHLLAAVAAAAGVWVCE